MENGYKVVVKEEKFCVDGLDFLCIYGRHSNGRFVAIIDWGVSVELMPESDDKSDVFDNRSILLRALENSPDAQWLPNDAKERSAIASELAMMIGERISEMTNGRR